MKKFICVLALIICHIICVEHYPSEKDVFILDEQNFGFAMTEYKFLFVLFYSKDDPNCLEIIPKFEKIASILKKENYGVGKIDSDTSPKLIRHLKIETFPSLVLMKKTLQVNYEGEKKQEEIIKWVKEQTKKEYTKISNKKELEEFKKTHDVTLVYCGKDEKNINEINLAERRMDDIPMGIIGKDELIKENAETPDKNNFIILFTKFDGKHYLYDIKDKNIIEFYNLYFTPKVSEFSGQTSTVLFSKRLDVLIIFSLKKEKQWEESKNLLEKIWPKVNRKLKLFIGDIEEGISVKLSEYCGVKESEIPVAFIIEPVDQNPIKYKFEGQLNEDNLLKFVEKWENKKLKPYLKSEDEPEYNDGDVFVVVGKTYKKEILDNDKDVVMYFFAPWCDHCKEFYPKFEKFARKLKKKNPKLLFAKMDSTENDIEDLPINRYPTIKFYPGNAKNKQPIHFSNRQSITELCDLIKQKAFHKINDEDFDKKEFPTTDL